MGVIIFKGFHSLNQNQHNYPLPDDVGIERRGGGGNTATAPSRIHTSSSSPHNPNLAVQPSGL